MTGTPLSDLSRALEAAVAGAAPSIVSVATPRGRISGFAWRPGLFVSAEESVPEDGEIRVNGEPAEVVGRDPSTDIVLLRAAATATPATLSDTVPGVGALALAVGAHESSASAAFGIVAVSAGPWRSLRGGRIESLIRLDLAMPRDAEGGLALDAEGRPFGMAVFGPRRHALVIPAATIARVAERLATHGRIARGWLGLAMQPVALDGGGAGAMVMAVAEGGPGAAVGMRQGDIVTAWDGAPVQGLRGMVRALGAESVGSVVTLTVARGGETRDVALTVAERPAT